MRGLVPAKVIVTLGEMQCDASAILSRNNRKERLERHACFCPASPRKQTFGACELIANWSTRSDCYLKSIESRLRVSRSPTERKPVVDLAIRLDGMVAVVESFLRLAEEHPEVFGRTLRIRRDRAKKLLCACGIGTRDHDLCELQLGCVLQRTVLQVRH